MRTLLVATLVTLAALNPALAQDQPDRKQLSYDLGLLIGARMTQQLQNFPLEIEPADLARGFEAGFSNPDDSEGLAKAQAAVQAFQRQRQMTAGKAAQEAGAAFLAENGQREGVTTTASGLQYEIMEAGSGAKPAASDTVTVHYRGTLLNGTEFDSSHSRGEPATFPLSNVIPGWTEGVQLMQVGATHKLFVPAELAYGARGAGNSIGPNETLIFEVQLIKIGE